VANSPWAASGAAAEAPAVPRMDTLSAEGPPVSATPACAATAWESRSALSLVTSSSRHHAGSATMSLHSNHVAATELIINCKDAGYLVTSSPSSPSSPPRVLPELKNNIMNIVTCSTKLKLRLG